jgi:acetoin utilization deacetylase AcuC-like enzyme
MKKLGQTGTLAKVETVSAGIAKDTDILRTHSLGYLNDFRKSCAQGYPGIGYGLVSHPYDPRTEALIEVSSANSQWGTSLPSIRQSAWHDTPISPDSLDGALYSAGSVLSAIKSIEEGGPKRSFCLTRPPGHHAEYDTAMGFCFFNNVAVGAHDILSRQPGARIAIIDFDVHHGNGTQHLFYHDPRVLVYNIHRDPSSFYPYFCGFAKETGAGAGLGYNVNVALDPASGPNEYRAAFEALAKRIDGFRPDWLLVSSGFDAHKSDPLGGMKLNSRDYKEFARRLAELSDSYCQGRMVSVLEGGYNLGALAACVDAYLQGLLEA